MVKNKKANPYTLVFGKEPSQLLSRYPNTYDVIEDFESDNSQHLFMISGVRGSGKTVMLTNISNHFAKDDDWYVIDLSSDLNLLSGLVAELGNKKGLEKAIALEKVAISLPGISIEARNTNSITDGKVAITKLLELVKKQNRRVLVTIDEVINNASVKTFVSVFQILIRQQLPIYLLMTGLYENIHALQNEKTLTFLYRAPRIEMKPINLITVAKSYKSTLNIDDESAKEMAKLTKGYPFAFQVLGYFTWNNEGRYNDIQNEYREYLQNYVYEKIWMEMSPKDRKLAIGIAKAPNKKTEEIKAILEIEQNELNPYRKRLMDKGLIETGERGYIRFSLPCFDQFVIEQEMYS